MLPAPCTKVVTMDGLETVPGERETLPTAMAEALAGRFSKVTRLLTLGDAPDCETSTTTVVRPAAVKASCKADRIASAGALYAMGPVATFVVPTVNESR